MEQNFDTTLTSRFLQVRDMYILPGVKWIVENHGPPARPLLARGRSHHIALHLMIDDLLSTASLFQRSGAVNKNTKVDAHYAENRCFTNLFY